MTATFKYLVQKTNDIFENHMRRAAIRINARQHLLSRHAA